MKVTGKLTIESMLTLDSSGHAKPPTLRQLQIKEVASLWARDTTSDKRRYIGDVGVIYYLGDPKSPVKQRGLSEGECLKEAIINYNLPKDYVIDPLVATLINKYYIENITEAGVALEAMQRSVHIAAIGANRINELLNKKLTGELMDEDVSILLDLISRVNKQITELPALTKALVTATENLKNETEETFGRGGQSISSSMNADEDD